MTTQKDREQPDLAAENAGVIREFRQNGGRVGGAFAGVNLLLLHTIGAKSGHPRLTPLGYRSEGDRYYVMDGTSFYGATKKPDWFYNLLADPNVTIEVGADRFRAIARVLTGEERLDIWSRFASDVPQRIARSARCAEREFPIVELTRVS